MNDDSRLYGTKVNPTISKHIEIGVMSFTLERGALRHIKVSGTEIIRGIAFLVRDRDWGTLAPHLTIVSCENDGEIFSLHLDAKFSTESASLDVAIFIEATNDMLTVRANGTTKGVFETNRAGFTVLHSAGLAGCPVSIRHSDGSIQPSTFPYLIEPWQPFKDITSITHAAGDLTVDCSFKGDSFEMEDQRQWGDASYKTYVRPLALPWPYVLSQTQPLIQSVSIKWRKNEKPISVANKIVSSGKMLFPDTALLLMPNDAMRLTDNPTDIGQVSPQRLLCHLDLTNHVIKESCAAYAALQAAMPHLLFDLELICGFKNVPRTEMALVRSAMEDAGFQPDSVMVCPAIDRISTPPGSEWPFCPPLAEIHSASADIFGNFIRGGGMVTFFTELNRKRPPLENLDFVSHGLCPIVHAADDISVMETLEAIPHITYSARAIIGHLDYRVGPSTIAMRHNPYGEKTIPNPDSGRVCMTDDDPRHRALFGAAYTVGMATALANSGASTWTPSEIYGPRGLYGPIKKAISLLAKCAGKAVHNASISNGLAELEVGNYRIAANLTNQFCGGLRPYEFVAN